MNVKLLIDNIAELDLQCKELLASNISVLITIKNALNLLAVHYAEAKENFINDTFESSKQQIDYFKLYHSQMISLCLFYKSIRSIERRLIYKSITKQLEILKEEIEALDYILQDHNDFIIYITENASHFDKDYFILSTQGDSFDNFSNIERDPTFSTHHSSLLGKILSSHKTLNYINRKLDSLKNKSNQNAAPLDTLNWNRKKVEYVEVIRALHAESAFTEEISHVFKVLSQVIITGPLDHFSIFKDIRQRTNSKSKYLEKVAEALQETIINDYE